MPFDASEAVTGWLRCHHGVISAREASRLGLTRGQVGVRVRTGEWEQVRRGVYRIAGSPRGPLSNLRAAVLAGGPGAMASHLSAAWLWNFADEPSSPALTIPHGRTRSVPGVRVARSRIPARVVVRKGIPCTDPVRTIVDCATSATGRDLDDLIDRALARRTVRTDDLIRVAEDRLVFGRHPGRSILGGRLAARGVTGAPAPSVLESRMARLLAGAALPAPVAELVWGPQRRYRLDYAYADLKLAVEVDGHAFHFTPEQQRWDNRRSNALTSAGWTVLHYSWWDVSYEPERVAAEIAGALVRRSSRPAAPGGAGSSPRPGTRPLSRGNPEGEPARPSV